MFGIEERSLAEEMARCRAERVATAFWRLTLSTRKVSRMYSCGCANVSALLQLPDHSYTECNV